MKTIYIDTDESLNKRKAKKIAKKLYKMSKKEEIVIALSNNIINAQINSEKLELNKNENSLIFQINNYGLKILDGKWLFKFLINDIIEYITKKEDKTIENLNVVILMDSVDDIICKQVLEIAKIVKVLKIISKERYKLLYLEAELYNKFGIGLQITNNRRKALKDVDMIINCDFNEDRLREFTIPEKALLVNIKENIHLSKSEFRGRSFNNYLIEYKSDNFLNQKDLSNFDKNILYESYIYRKDTFENIKKQIDKDNVKLIDLK